MSGSARTELSRSIKKSNGFHSARSMSRTMIVQWSKFFTMLMHPRAGLPRSYREYRKPVITEERTID
jgi:hypothetical protein